MRVQFYILCDLSYDPYNEYYLYPPLKVGKLMKKTILTLEQDKNHEINIKY